jgi:Wiskott-Aldrich syndrome protein
LLVAYSSHHTGTAASSPVTIPHDLGTPEPEHIHSSIPPIQSTEEQSLDAVPLPIYPLPSKPFPVQPPLKIGTGFAPLIPLDKTGKIKVRHWRPAHREVRGIAGGRWFTRAWVGEKESEFASHVAARAAAAEIEKQATPGAVALPKLPSLSGASSGKGKSKSARTLSAASTSVSAAPSRSGSVNPESHGMPHATRAPTKMRTIVAPNSDGENDVEMPPSEPVES